MTQSLSRRRAHDVAGNDELHPRLFVILMHDAAGGNDPFDRHAGVRIANGVIDQLGPEDKAAVVFTRDNRHAQDLTADRTLLRRAVERFTPMHTLSAFPLLQQLEIIDAAGAVVHTASRALATDAFAEGAGVEHHRFELPLATLAAGDYLLRFVATAGEARAQRDVRFWVRQAGAPAGETAAISLQ